MIIFLKVVAVLAWVWALCGGLLVLVLVLAERWDGNDPPYPMWFMIAAAIVGGPIIVALAIREAILEWWHGSEDA